MNKLEILSPAGDLKKLETAYRYGADACYMGVKSLSMRVKENEIGAKELEQALKLKNKLGKKLYLTMNIHAHESRLNFLEKEIEGLKKLHKKKLDPDAILVSDTGVFLRLKEECPWIPLHVSTQANTLNSAGIEFWAKQGATRVVLGREVSLREAKQIREELKKRKVKIELEGFVHGAMCMAYSGRCLLSNFMTNRDANEGMCAHSCRWRYKVHEGRPKSDFFLEEELRPGQFIPIDEDEHGSYLMSSRDMCMVEHMADLIDAGIDSLKIEGRHKTTYYTALTARAYRQALDLAMKGKPVTSEILELVESVNTRGYFTGFWYGKPGAEGQKYEEKSNTNEHFCFAGLIAKVKGDQITLEVKNTLKKGDQLDIVTPTKTIPFKLGSFKNAKTGETIEIAHPGQAFSIIFRGIKGMEIGFLVRKQLTHKP